jgi:hypothetical protein
MGRVTGAPYLLRGLVSGLVLACSLLFAVSSPVSSLEAAELQQQEAGELLLAAFRNQYEVDLTARIELVIRNRSGLERRRIFEAASRIIDDRVHSIGRLTHPEHLRGMTILQVETPERSHDAFVYLPSMRSVRRVSTAQRGDAFFGTDLSYEDLERRHTRDFRITGAWPDRSGDEEVIVVAATPKRPRRHAEIRFWIALRDHAILRVGFYKRGAREPFRTISAPRQQMQRAAGHVLPTKLVVENHSRGTTTIVRYHELRIDPVIDERLFSIRTLERGGRIRAKP